MTAPVLPLGPGSGIADPETIAELVYESRMLHTHLVFDLPRPRAVRPTAVRVEIPETAAQLVEGMSTYVD